jgi:hypothetical protein
MWELSKRENEGEWQAVGMGHQLTDAPTDTRSVVWHQVLANGYLIRVGVRFAAQKRVIVGRGIRLLVSLRNQEVTADG